MQQEEHFSSHCVAVWVHGESTDLLVVKMLWDWCLYIFLGSIYRFITFSRDNQNIEKKKQVSGSQRMSIWFPVKILAGQSKMENTTPAAGGGTGAGSDFERVPAPTLVKENKSHGQHFQDLPIRPQVILASLANAPLVTYHDSLLVCAGCLTSAEIVCVHTPTMHIHSYWKMDTYTTGAGACSKCSKETYSCMAGQKKKL